MSEIIKDQLKRSLQIVDDMYYRLVLLVGEVGTGKTKILRDLADELGVPVININLTLATKLLDLTVKQRPSHLAEIMNNLLDKTQAIVIFDNVEILFDKNLQHDPLRVLQNLSRNHTIITSWSGTLSHGKLIYAEKDHPEYRSYDKQGLMIINMDGTANIELITEANKV
jgi:Cdc6-like AAA superfamily ATPase